jgi:hypothetical protein
MHVNSIAQQYSIRKNWIQVGAGKTGPIQFLQHFSTFITTPTTTGGEQLLLKLQPVFIVSMPRHAFTLPGSGAESRMCANGVLEIESRALALAHRALQTQLSRLDAVSYLSRPARIAFVFMLR